MTNARPTAIVTGSTSGIGRAAAVRLLAAGYRVVLNYANDHQRAKRTLADCQGFSPDVLLEQADIADPDSAARLVARAVSEYGRLDVLVNNAAHVIDKPALEMTESDWDRVFGVNLKGAFLCSQHAARQMLQQTEGGSIINIGAPTGIRGRRNGVNTCASKAGLMMMTQCLALELAPKIRVNTIVPGLVLTDETERRFNLGDPQTLHARIEAIPMNRLGTPDDVANAVMILLANDASFITGQRLFVDGGQNMW
jgi:NAD(P)-dependent dehydrogenase (short-subunit alcohol dehydrogenase family)